MKIRTLLPALALAFVGLAQAQSPAVPRTPEGKPDFQGVWDSSWLTPVERLDAVPSVKLRDEDREAALKVFRGASAARLNAQLGSIGEEGDATELARVDGTWRGAQVVDPPTGKIPFIAGLAPYITFDDGPEAFPPNARCVGGATRPPMTIGPLNMLRQIVQTNEHVVIHGGLGEVRIVRIGPRKSRPVSDLGESIARWEGDTLVIETDGFDGRIPMRGPPLPRAIRAGRNAVLTERLSLSGPDEIVYRYTLADPDHYSRPWSAEYNMTRSTQRMFELSCHEGNYSMPNMLGGAREMERLAALRPPK